VGTSARSRSVEWPLLDPRQCAERLVAAAAEGPVAILFGRESSGLTNDELDRCRYLVHIPSNPDYSSLNVAMAAQVLAYEVLMASGERAVVPGVRTLATAERFEGFMEHLSATIDEVGFADPRLSHKLMRRLRLLFLRAELDGEEINLLRGILKAAQTSARRDQ
jgi:tRNA (cytidine32/uridine32-2'-O)-methyltransferase